jgi:hypothetical protein
MEDTVLPFLILTILNIYCNNKLIIFAQKKKGTRVPPLRISEFLGEGSLILVYYIVFI